jgi:hypothetical protein
MNYEVVIGFKAEDIDAVSDRVRTHLGISFERRETHYLGEYNRFRVPEELLVKYNYVLSEQEWDEPEHREYEILLVIAKTDRPEYFQELSAQLGMETKVIRCRELRV